jgi:hypothetical protein
MPPMSVYRMTLGHGPAFSGEKIIPSDGCVDEPKIRAQAELGRGILERDRHGWDFCSFCA